MNRIVRKINVKKKWKSFWKQQGHWLNFAFIYAIIVTLATFLLGYSPAARVLENALFDDIQRQWAVDSKSDYHYRRYQNEIDRLCLINLDSSFIDRETDRVSKTKLLNLLNSLSNYEELPESVLLDYIYQPIPGDTTDELLCYSLKKFGNKLILPLSVKLLRAPTLRGESSRLDGKDMEVLQPTVIESASYGYAQPLNDSRDGLARYFKYFADDKSYFSAPWQIYKHSAGAFSNDVKELHYILRNHDLQGKDRAVYILNGQDISNGKIPKEALESMLTDKVVVIGLLGEYTSKYGQKIETFQTPVDNEMHGSLVLANAWLNLVTDSCIRNSPLWLIFLLNFLIGMSIRLKVQVKKSKTRESIINMVIGLVVSLVLFYYLSVIFLIFWHIKLSLGVSLLLYQHQGLMWTWWKERHTNKSAIVKSKISRYEPMSK